MDGFTFGQPPYSELVGNIIMTKFVRLAALAAAVTLVATPALAAPVSASPKAKASAKIIKPLILTANRDLDFGTIVVGAVVGTQTVAVSQAGALSGCNTNGLTCSGTVQSAQYNVQGSNNQVVHVRTTPSTLNGPLGTLTFTPTANFDVTLANSGSPGLDFNIGGSIDLVAATPEGLYVGDMEVTVDYF